MGVLSARAGSGGCATTADLFRQAQAGCQDSLNRLMAEHDGLVHAVVRQQVLGTLPFGDALSAGRIGLWRAILGYDSRRGLAFSTYAWPSIAHQIWGAVKQHNRDARRHNDIIATVRITDSNQDPDPVTAWESTAVQSAMQDLVARLPGRLRTVVVAHYGLDGAPPRSFAAIGTTMGLCRERIRQLHTEALIWLRHPAHSQHLRSLLDRHTLADYEWADAQAQTWLRQRR